MFLLPVHLSIMIRKMETLGILKYSFLEMNGQSVVDSNAKTACQNK